MERTVRYDRMGNVVVLNFPNEDGARHFIMQLETQNILRKMKLDNTPVHPRKKCLSNREW